MECDTITTTQLDMRLEGFIDPYITNGTTVTHGALIVRRLPDSRCAPMILTPSSLTCRRPRPASVPSKIKHFNFPISRYTGMQNEVISGLYQLRVSREILPGGWLAWLQSLRSTNTADIELPEFIDLMGSGRPFGTQCPDLKS